VTRVLYVGGFGRSGSTLLDRVLAQVGGFVAVGELVHLVQRGLIDDERCGCGEPFSACPFWGEVGVAAFGAAGWRSVDADAVRRQQASLDRNRRIPALVLPQGRRRSAAATKELGTWFSRIYAAVADVSGASVVVDSSKHASTAFLLRRAPGLDLRVVHLVRDSRGVAYSWAKRVQRPEVQGSTDEMPRYGAGRSAAKWLSYNSLFHLLAATGVPTLPLRYEQLVADPRTAIQSVLELAGLDASAEGFGFVDPSGPAVELAPSHSVAGNPMRFRSGRLGLVLDEEWRERMPASSRSVVTAITAPLLTSYGYGRKSA
jgi:LPS sulfotransferase NodH